MRAARRNFPREWIVIDLADRTDAKPWHDKVIARSYSAALIAAQAKYPKRPTIYVVNPSDASPTERRA